MIHQLPPGQRRAFVDASAYLGLMDRRDNHHIEASEVARQIIRTRCQQFTSNAVVIETHVLIMSHLGIEAGIRFLRNIDQGDIIVIRASAADEERAKQIIYQYQDKDFSFTDAISFAIMERLDISYAFTFDRHFAQFGFTLLTPELF